MDWAESLERMYYRWAASQGYKVAGAAPWQASGHSARSRAPAAGMACCECSAVQCFAFDVLRVGLSLRVPSGVPRMLAGLGRLAQVVQVDRIPGEEAGVKSVELQVEGRWAYGYLKGEALMVARV